MSSTRGEDQLSRPGQRLAVLGKGLRRAVWKMPSGCACNLKILSKTVHKAYFYSVRGKNELLLLNRRNRNYQDLNFTKSTFSPLSPSLLPLPPHPSPPVAGPWTVVYLLRVHVCMICWWEAFAWSSRAFLVKIFSSISFCERGLCSITVVTCWNYLTF